MIDEQNQQEQPQTQPDEVTENSGDRTSAAGAAEEPIAAEAQETQAANAEQPGEPEMETTPPEAGEAATADPAAAAAATAEQLEAMEALVQANQAFTAQLEDLKNQHARLAADFDNFRKRTQKEKEDLELQSKCATIRELLVVVDNFERAKEQLKPQTDGEMNIHKSYLSVYKQMVECLKRIGVSAMYPKGQEFDPNLHEAVMREPTNEYPEGTVTDDFRRGYMLGDRVLRHAMVKVAAPLENEEEPPAEEAAEAPAQEEE
ncbi:nucleotide exchange factor GrpE [Phormidium sp. CCY1219]|uniref:nucleotide exchange factor GrpE n=1 Tax=Phormidium sp. CCY1219 TaxID=2886104 RepID=UPI003FA78C45